MTRPDPAAVDNRRGCRVSDDRPGPCGFDIAEHDLENGRWICPPWHCLGRYALIHETQDDISACAECMRRTA